MNAEQEAFIASETGKEYLSDWITVDQPMIDSFADTTRDHMYLHIDPEAAARTDFGGTIAHGFLTVSLLAPMRNTAGRPAFPGMRDGLNYGIEGLRFLKPVRSGKRIRGRFTVSSITETGPGRFRERMATVVEIEGEDKPALVADWLTMYLT
jgi:acyl dehydratase